MSTEDTYSRIVPFTFFNVSEYMSTEYSTVQKRIRQSNTEYRYLDLFSVFVVTELSTSTRALATS